MKLLDIEKLADTANLKGIEEIEFNGRGQILRIKFNGKGALQNRSVNQETESQPPNPPPPPQKPKPTTDLDKALSRLAIQGGDID